MVKLQSLTGATLVRIWKQHQPMPHLAKIFKLGRNQRFVDRLAGGMGLFLDPPDKSRVMRVDKESQVRKRDWTQPA